MSIKDLGLICFLSSEHPPFDKRVFDKEARSLADAGYGIVHLCPNHQAEECHRHGVTIITYPKRRGKISRLLGLFDLYRQARDINADAYHCNEPDSWLVGLLMRLLHGKGVVFDCHEHYPGQIRRWLPPFLGGVGALLIRWYLQLMGLFTHLIVLAKYSVADHFSWSKKRVLLVLNATSLRFMKEPNIPPRAKHPNEPFRFVHIGVIRRERGSELMLDAMEHLTSGGRRDFQIVIIGEFKDGSKNDFHQKAERKGLKDLIVFHPWLPFEDAYQILSGCDAGLILFQPELKNNVFGMPHKMFDYMLAGLPFIAPDFAPDIARVVRDATCGVLIDTSNPIFLAEAMRRLIDDRKFREELGSNGRRAARERYNWEAEAEKLIAAYHGLLSKSK